MPSATPLLVVFDLDLTLWSCGGLWIDCTSYPFRQDAGGRIWDSDGREMRLYADVADILDRCDFMGIDMALASRTGRPDWAREMLDLLGIRDRFVYDEIFPSSKVAHFANLRDASGFDYTDMLFFDDEPRNIIEVGALGVTSIDVPSGLDMATFEQGLAAHESR